MSFSATLCNQLMRKHGNPRRYSEGKRFITAQHICQDEQGHYIGRWFIVVVSGQWYASLYKRESSYMTRNEAYRHLSDNK